MSRKAGFPGKKALASFVLLAAFCRAQQDVDIRACDHESYVGADSRLQRHIVGLLPVDKGQVVGFEVVHDRPLVAFPHSVVAFQKVGAAELPVIETIKGLSSEKDSGVLLQSDRGFLRLGERSLQPDQRLDGATHGRIYGSGSEVTMEVRSRQGVLQFIARRDDGTAFPIASIKGPFRAASWNDQGLATVVGDSLYLWQPGAKNVVRLLTDRGLAGARDVVAVGTNRVVVALKTTVVLVTPETITVVGVFPSSRCRFANGTLYVLEESNGLIWSFRGLENLGTKQADEAYARDLLKNAAKSPEKSAMQIEEAARIVGCKEAEKASEGTDKVGIAAPPLPR